MDSATCSIVSLNMHTKGRPLALVNMHTKGQPLTLVNMHTKGLKFYKTLHYAYESLPY